MPWPRSPRTPCPPACASCRESACPPRPSPTSAGDRSPRPVSQTAGLSRRCPGRSRCPVRSSPCDAACTAWSATSPCRSTRRTTAPSGSAPGRTSPDSSLPPSDCLPPASSARRRSAKTRSPDTAGNCRCSGGIPSRCSPCGNDSARSETRASAAARLRTPRSVAPCPDPPGLPAPVNTPFAGMAAACSVPGAEGTA